MENGADETVIGGLTGPKGCVIQSFHTTLVERKFRAELVEADASERLAPAKSRKWLAENRILLALQLCEQSGNTLRIRLVDSTTRNQLIYQVLNILPAQSRERSRWNIE
jgi:hypothetical protein